MSADQSNNETEWFRRIADGDPVAFAEFFRRYFDRLYLVIFKYTKRHTEAEDIVQSVFIKAWEKRHIFREMGDPMSWFFITARNEYFDSFRKARKSREYRQYLAEVFSESDISPETIFANKEYTAIYHEAIANLPDKQRQAYLLSREKELTYEAIAREMNVGKSTVKEHIARAIKSIRAFFLSRINHPGEILFFLLFFKLVSAAVIAHTS